MYKCGYTFNRFGLIRYSRQKKQKKNTFSTILPTVSRKENEKQQEKEN